MKSAIENIDIIIEVKNIEKTCKLPQFKDIASLSLPGLVSDLFTISNALDNRSLKPFSTPTTCYG